MAPERGECLSAAERGAGCSAPPVFVGLSHLGQVFSIGWALKFGGCAVVDPNPERLGRFRDGRLTPEEPDLAAAFQASRGHITVLEHLDALSAYDTVFVTLDTPLNLAGEPDVGPVRALIEHIAPALGRGARLVVVSQVYPGFCARLKSEVLASRPDLRLVYMVDTLKMGCALPRFLEPERLIFGVDDSEDVPPAFSAFSCPRFVLTHGQAEMVKMAINLYLLFSVSFANALDNYCQQFGFGFAPIAPCLRADARIGSQAYIAPSLGISGGHLERDLTTVLRTCRDDTTRQLFQDLLALNRERMARLDAAIMEPAAHPVRSVLWIGASYKPESFSLVNSPCLKFVQAWAGRLRLSVYDGRYAVPPLEGAERVMDLEAAARAADCLIFNYGGRGDAERLQRGWASGIHQLVLDVSLPPSLPPVPSAATGVQVRRIC